MEMQNTLKLDLALLAKNHYNVAPTRYVAAARRICAAHVLMYESSLTQADTLRWLLKEFCTETDQPIIPVNKVIDVLFDEIVDKSRWLRDLANEGDAGVTYRSIEAMLCTIRNTRVRDGDVALHPSIIGEIDPQVVKLLEDLAPREYDSGDD